MSVTRTKEFRANDLKTSVGGELSLDVVAIYSFPFTATVGAAGSRWVERRNNATAYVRVGRAF
jgi:hypothetical protein